MNYERVEIWQEQRKFSGFSLRNEENSGISREYREEKQHGTKHVSFNVLHNFGRALRCMTQ
jgi:hypothetical protein